MSILQRTKEVYSCTYFDEHDSTAPSLVEQCHGAESSCLSSQLVPRAAPCSTDGKELQPLAAAGAAAQTRDSNITTIIARQSRQQQGWQPARPCTGSYAGAARNAFLHGGGSRNGRSKRKAVQSAQDALLARALQKELSRADSRRNHEGKS